MSEPSNVHNTHEYAWNLLLGEYFLNWYRYQLAIAELRLDHSASCNAL